MNQRSLVSFLLAGFLVIVAVISFGEARLIRGRGAQIEQDVFDEVAPLSAAAEHRELWGGDTQAIYNRCCGTNVSSCKCPIRRWGWFPKLWKRKCDKIKANLA
jgi:hypothetical protein